ncbi:MAG: M24 family metallopeptidase [Marinicella sp.]
MTSRLAQISLRLKQEQIDAILVFYDHNITYLSGFTGHAATALIMPDEAYLLTDYRYFEQAKEQACDFTVICRDRIKQSLAALIAELCSKHAVKTLSFEADHISHGAWLNMTQDWGEIVSLPVSRWVEDLRYTKDVSEINSIQSAAKIADQALAELIRSIKVGITERELAIELEYQMALLGSEEPSFNTIMLAAERSALPHGIPGDKKLAAGDLLLIDFGATINGYHSDMTRTFILGQADAKQKEIYQTVLSAQQAAMDALTIGISGNELHQIAKGILDQSPYAAYQGEGLGHGLGLDLHELPLMGMGQDLAIKKHTVITIEPGIYIPGWGGVRIEDDVVLTDDGLLQLTQSPRELMEL